MTIQQIEIKLAKLREEYKTASPYKQTVLTWQGKLLQFAKDEIVKKITKNVIQAADDVNEQHEPDKLIYR